jgi:hypothetical protein
VLLYQKILPNLLQARGNITNFDEEEAEGSVLWVPMEDPATASTSRHNSVISPIATKTLTRLKDEAVATAVNPSAANAPGFGNVIVTVDGGKEIHLQIPDGVSVAFWSYFLT